MHLHFSKIYEQHFHRYDRHHSHHIFGQHPHLLRQHFWATKPTFGKYSADSTLKGLFAHANKCGFHVTSCEYLRYMLSPEGLTMAPYKVQIIQDWPVPQKVKDIQSFLSFANFYHHFIYRYSEITVPLMHLTRKGTPGISLMSAILPLKHLKRLSPQLQSLPIGFQTPK